MGSMRLIGAAVLVAVSMATAYLQPMWANASVGHVHCGFFEFVPADAENQGSIAFGAASAVGVSGHLFVIAAGASVPPNLAELAGGTPTCLELTREAGVITHMQYAPTGTIHGRVVVYGDAVGDPENSAYVVAGRIMSPVDGLEEQPGLWTIFNNAVATGRAVNVVLNIHPDYGFPLSFSASTFLHGKVVVNDSDIGVGLGTLPDAVIDPDSRSLLEQAATLGGSAHVGVTSVGTIDLVDGALDITTTLDVVLTNEPVAGSIVGPCGGSEYYAVFDNSQGAATVRFRLRWTSNHRRFVQVKFVPGGAIYRTSMHRVRPGTFLRLSYKDPDTGRWMRLTSQASVQGSFPACEYQRGFELVPH